MLVEQPSLPAAVSGRRPTPSAKNRDQRHNRTTPKKEREATVAKERTDFEENAQRTMNAASFGANWMAEVAEHNMQQSMTAVEGMLTIMRRAADGFTQQANAIRERSLAVAEEAMGNAAEFGNRIVRLRDPLEWAEVQSEFLSRQAQTLAEGNRKLGEALIQQSNELTDATLNQARDNMRKRAEAA